MPTTRRRINARALGAVLALLAFSARPAAATVDDARAREIIDRVDRLLRGRSSVGEVEMQIVAERWQRRLVVKIWSKGTEKALIVVLEPAKEAGLSTLKVGTNMWNYLPKVERVIKIPASMLMGSWMGSHFTNDDVVKESRLAEDYDITLPFEGPRDGVMMYEFVLHPKPEAAVVWGRIESQVRQADLMPTWMRYYDEDGILIRTLSFADYREMDGQLVPSRMTMQPADAPEEHTVVIYRGLQFDVPLDDGFFSLRSLRQRARTP